MSLVRRLAPSIGLVALALSGCNLFDRPADPDPGDREWDPSMAVLPDGEGTGEAGDDTPLTAASLRPAATPVGDAGAAPRSVVFHLARSVFDPALVGQRAPAGTEIQVEPAVPGQVEILGPSTVAFRPDQGFAPSTTYTARLVSVTAQGGALAVPEGQGLARFATPDLALLRLMPTRTGPQARRAKGLEMQLVFSGPVDVSSVQRKVQVAHSAVGDLTRTAAFSPVPGYTNRVALTLRGPATEREGELSATVGAGYVSSVGRASGAGGSGTFAFDPTGPLVDVKSAHLVEGTSGFAIQIVCDDDASKGYERWNWFEEIEDSFRTSPRCLPTEESARDLISLSPAVDFTVVRSSGGFRIQGPIARGGLQLTLGAGLTTVDGGALGESLTYDLTVPQLSPTVSLSASGRYLPRGAWRSLSVQHRNIEELRVQVRHVPERNLVFWLTSDSEQATARVADRIVDQKIPVRGSIDERSTTFLDLASLVPDAGPGIYEVEVSGGGAKDVRRLLTTDTSLVVKGLDPKAEGTLHVWALDAHTGAHQGGVEIRAILPSGKAVGTCTTGTDGCVVKVTPDPLDESAPVALIARRGSDVTYLKFSELQTDLSDHKVQGESYAAEVPYRAALWTERGVFRPGETAHVAGIVRDADRVAPPRNMPIDIEIRDPRNQVMRTLAVRLNAAGMFEVAVPFADFARTGSYRVVAKAGGKPLGEVALGVEEFVPERMAVEASIDGAGYRDTDAIPVRAEARYLFGGSAAGHQAELNCRLVPTTFAPESAKGYAFGDAAADRRPVDLGTVSGTLDDEGKGVLTCPELDRIGRVAGASTLVADLAVFEAGSGRTTQRTARVPVHADDHYVGLQVGAQTLKAGEPAKVQGVVVDWQGKPITAAVDVDIELVRVDTEWGYVYDDDRGGERWQRIQRPISLGSQQVRAEGGKFATTVTAPSDAGMFRIVAKVGQARSSVQVQGEERWWWWGDGERDRDATPRPLKPTAIALDLPEQVKVGERAQVGFTAPYKGRLLLTVETDEVLRSEWRRVDAGPGTFDFTLGEFVDNVYVSAMLIKDPHLESQESYLPDRAFGVGSVKVEPTDYLGSLKVTAPSEVRSGSPLDIDLDLGPGKGPRYVTVAAVDEGILSLTDFASPDPTTDLFPTRALGVKTWETVGWSLHLPASGASRSTGGDGEGAMPGRVQMVKPVSLWSGLVEVPESGKARVSFDVPQYRGKLRVMAVSAGRTRVASADTAVLVRDPVIVQTTVPRVLVQGDRAEIPVFLTNVSGKRRDVDVSLTAELLAEAGVELRELGLEPIKFEGAQEARVTLDDGESRTVVFRVRTHLPAGALRFETKAESGDVSVGETLDVPVEPDGPRTRTAKLVELTSGSLDVAGLLGGWTPGSERTTVWVTNNPYGQSFAHLGYVIRYPYGCIEQTTSTLRPLLYAGALIQTADPTLARDKPVDELVRAGIERLFSMQTAQGGFAYWQGGTTPTAWGTAYATHLLLDARDAGYDVPEGGLNDAVAWLGRTVDTRSDVSDFHGATPGGRAYMHYVLARAGQGNAAAIQATLATVTGTSGQDAEARTLLMAALYLTGDRRYESELRKPDTSPIVAERRNDWTFYSDLRRRAFVLSVYADLFGTDGADPLARRVADALADGRPSGRYTTQELAWGLSGLGKLVLGGARDYEATLSAGSRKLDPDAWGAGRGGDVLSWSLVRASEVGSLDLRVAKKGDGKLYAMVQSEGVREDAMWTFGGDGLSVRREVLDTQGRTVNLDDVELGDLMLVRVVLTNQTRSRVQNLALVDRVPAGFEIENTRLGRGLAPDWVDEDAQWGVDYQSVRDDRVEAFGALAPGQTAELVYTVRAVTAGSFTQPPVEVEAMYDPSIWARQPGRTVRIHGPWAGFYL